MKQKSATKIVIPAVEWVTVNVTLRGTAPLIVNNFDTKSQQQMEDAQKGKASNKRPPKDPDECYERARLRDQKGRDCVSALWIKCACVDSARYVHGVKMTELRGALFIEGELLPLKFKSVRQRRDTVRNANGVADLRYRPEYTDWSVDVAVKYRPDMLTPESVMNLLNNAGQSIGLCERRPAQNGDHYGTFEVDPNVKGGAKKPRTTKPAKSGDMTRAA